MYVILYNKQVQSWMSLEYAVVGSLCTLTYLIMGQIKVCAPLLDNINCYYIALLLYKYDLPLLGQYYLHVNLLYLKNKESNPFCIFC